MHHKHRWVNASLSEPMPWGSNCFYLWWFPNHVWWGAWVVPGLPACKRVNGWGLIAINCACVAFALMQKLHGATSCRLLDGADSSDLLPLQHTTACVEAIRPGQMWTIFVIVLLLTSYPSASLISFPPRYTCWCGLCGFKLIPFSQISCCKNHHLQHRAQLHHECSAWTGQKTDCNDCFTLKFASIKHVWLPKWSEQQIKQRRVVSPLFSQFPVVSLFSTFHMCCPSIFPLQAIYFYHNNITIIKKKKEIEVIERGVA